jgi:ABC-type uncharacterized transport system substrate-binding protein
VDRRNFFAVVVALIAMPLIADGQPQTKIYRLGLLSPAPFADLEVTSALRELGYVEGQNLVVERRYAEGDLDRLPSLARQLVQVPVDVIIAVGADAIAAAKESTKTIPIVMGFTTDPVRQGFVASLARPGGNITGVTYAVGPEISAKRVELLKEAVPRAKRLAVLSTAALASQTHVHQARGAASRLGVDIVVVEVRDGDYDSAFAAIAAKRADALYVLGSPILNRDRKRIIALAAKHHLPAIYEWREHVEEGGLMAYGGEISVLYRGVATYVDRLFKAANPADLPVQQPTTFLLAINLKTAKVLGITIPQSILVRADHVIQ